MYSLITGACKGIGKALAYELASRKMNVLLVSNDGDCLQGVCDDIRAKTGATSDSNSIARSVAARSFSPRISMG